MQYLYAESPLGYLMLAEQQPDAGLFLLYIGDHPEDLLTEAQATYPGFDWQQSEHLNLVSKSIV